MNVIVEQNIINSYYITIKHLEINIIQSARISLFHMKIFASVTKISHQYCDLSYLHLPIFFLYSHLPWLKNKKLKIKKKTNNKKLLENKVFMIAIYLSKLDHKLLFNDIYYKTILVWGLVSIWLTNAIHCL